MSLDPKYNASLPTLTEGQFGNGQLDASGRLLVSTGSGATSGGVQGAAADDAAVAGNPVLVAGKFETTLNVQENGDVSTMKTDQNGRQLVVAHASTSALTSVASSVTSVTILAANANRVGASIANTSSSILYLRLATGTADATTGHSVQMAANTYFEIPFGYRGAITGIWVSANGSANVTEYS